MHKLAIFFLSSNSICYDLGCSTGSLLNILSSRHCRKNIQWFGFDREEKMIEQAKINSDKSNHIHFVCKDLLDIEFEKSDLIIAYYTIQFIKPSNRQIILNRIYESLNWGGGFLFFEKVRAPDARFQDMMQNLYIDYKKDQGYQLDQILAKSRSLKGILEPFSTKGNYDLLSRAGFIDYMTIIKYICFEGFLAIK